MNIGLEIQGYNRGGAPAFFINCPRFICRIIQLPVAKTWVQIRCVDSTCRSNSGNGVRPGLNLPLDDSFDSLTP